MARRRPGTGGREAYATRAVREFEPPIARRSQLGYKLVYKRVP